MDHKEFRELESAGTRLLDLHYVIVIWVGRPEHPADALILDAGLELDPVIGERQRRPVHGDTAAAVLPRSVSPPIRDPAAFSHHDAGPHSVSRGGSGSRGLVRSGIEKQ